MAETELKVKNLADSLQSKFDNGEVTMREVQEQLYRAGWFNYVPTEKQVRELWTRTGAYKNADMFLERYREAKSEHPESVLLFHGGNFYEAYFTDAYICSKVLGITLTQSRTFGINMMCGFHENAFQSYLSMLSAEGLKVELHDGIMYA